jgi:single-strand DNA-binding protein
MYINKVVILGNLTRDPELKSLPNGTKVNNFSLATNRTWKDANGAKQEAVEYHNVVAFAKQAEVIAQWCKKGSQIYIEGRLTTRSWDDATTGKKAYKTEVVMENFQFGTSSKDGAGAGGGATGMSQSTSSAPANDAPKFEDNLGSIDYGDSMNPDDIPF